MLILKFMGHDDWDRPVYKDQNRKFWCDLNLGSSENVCLSSYANNSIDNDPDQMISEEYEFKEGHPYVEDRYRHKRMMFSRLVSDCDYFLKYEKSNETNLYWGNIEEQIKNMKQYWLDFPDDAKPKISIEDIEEYEHKMINELKKRNIKNGK